MTYEKAKEIAKKRAKRTNEIQFVIMGDDDEGFQPVNEFDLDTFYAGIRDADILEAIEPN